MSPKMPSVAPSNVSDTSVDGEAACPACQHPRADHDPIALRFCTATAAGGFNRGCVCTGGSHQDEPEKVQRVKN